MSALYVSNGNTSYAHWEITPQKVGRKTLYELSSELTLLSIRVCSVNNSILIMGKGLTEVKALSLFTYVQLLFNRVFFFWWLPEHRWHTKVLCWTILLQILHRFKVSLRKSLLPGYYHSNGSDATIKFNQVAPSIQCS